MNPRSSENPQLPSLKPYSWLLGIRLVVSAGLFLLPRLAEVFDVVGEGVEGGVAVVGVGV